MQLQWRASDGRVLGYLAAHRIPSLTGNWQETTAAASAAPGTVTFTVTISGTGAVAGNGLYPDDISVGT